MEFTLNEHDYRAVKLSVFDQLRVARKLLPLLADIVGNADGERALDSTLLVIAKAISELSDEDCNAIIHPSLSAVARLHQNSWVPVFSQGVLAFDDIDLLTMLSLVARVVADSLGNFLQELPGDVAPAPAAA